ncbi:hypothetical protein [Eubacterium ramulus]|uniref:hypothetical protein n=1 Tax=Eubacterium ramulus TaxID=39490 RepID=UPI00300EE54E
MRGKKRSKMLSLLLAIVLAVGMVPLSALPVNAKDMALATDDYSQWMNIGNHTAPDRYQVWCNLGNLVQKHGESSGKYRQQYKDPPAERYQC